MLKDGAFARLFIKFAVLGLRAIAPLCTIYCCLRLTFLTPRIPYGLLIALDIYTASESLFYFLVYLPRKKRLNRPAKEYLALRTREERRSTWIKTWDATPDPHAHVSLWFKGAPVEELRQEDVRDWIVWVLWNSTNQSVADEAELAEYVSYAENILQIRFPEGRSEYQPLLVTAEPLNMLHRPLIWYICFIGGADFASSLVLMLSGYQLYRLPFIRFFSTFPYRPLALLARAQSPARDISYWYLEHTSKTHIPVLYLHGIGVGIYPYVQFFREFRQQTRKDGVGLIALEVMPVCSRITSPVLRQQEMTYQIQQILQKHGWERCILMTHSYGSVIATQLLHDPKTAPLIGPLLFVDPVAFSFHAPYIAWNFLRRKPTTASEIELHYFASTDPDVNHALTRSFVWPELTLWREEVEDRARGEDGRANRCTVALAGQDIITHTLDLGRYLTREQRPEVKWYEETDCSYEDDWKTRKWTGDEPLEVVWFPGLNHAEVFDEQKDRQELIDILKRYSEIGCL